MKLRLVGNFTPVTLEDERGERNYRIRELTASERDAYLDQLATRFRLDAQGRPIGINKFDGHQADLLALCLEDEEGKRVDKAVIQKWPATTVARLFELAQQINQLREETEQKNT